MTGPYYIDHSAKIVGDEPSARAAQQALIDLGFDLGRSGADGDWGARSRAAATEWQRTNLYAQPDGDITERQLGALVHQAAHPEIYALQQRNYNAVQLQPFYENFDVSKLDHLPPARAAILMQHASHLGAQEDMDPEIGEGLNTGAAVEQYLSSDARAFAGNAWCASYGSWVLDQVERQAGLAPNEFHRGNMRVQEMSDQISRGTPQAIKTLDGYEPQGGDAMLILYGDGTGHYTTVVAALDVGGGMYAVVTIDGNSGDAVSLNEYAVMYDPINERNYIAYQDTDGVYYPDLSLEVKVIDVSELPNYDRLNGAFNASAAPFVPIPSSDPAFQHDYYQLSILESVIDQYREQRGIPVEPDIQPDYLGVEADVIAPTDIPPDTSDVHIRGAYPLPQI